MTFIRKNVCSAGILLFREKKDRNGRIKYKYLIGHPGGPFFTKKDNNYWSILKGIVEPGEDNITGAIREFKEESGINFSIKKSELIDLDIVKLRNGKTIHIFAWKDPNPEKDYKFSSNIIRIKYPTTSDKYISIPEIDEHKFYGKNNALKKLNSAQSTFIERFEEIMRKK